MMTDQEATAETTAAPGAETELDLAPLGEEATAADIAAAAEAHAQAAATARSQAGHGRAEAEEILATAKERAEQILAAAEEKAAPLRGLAAEADVQAAELGAVAAKLGTAAKCMSSAEQEDANAAGLWAERSQLTAKAAELTARAAAAQEQRQRLGARRLDLEAQLAGAGGDDELAIGLSGKISGITETEKQVAAAEQRIAADIAAARARITAIDRENPPLPPYPSRTPLLVSRRFRALGLCDEVWPERPGAARRRPDWYVLNHGTSVSAAAPQQQPRRNMVVRG
jgi:hypothetical protein